MRVCKYAVNKYKSIQVCYSAPVEIYKKESVLVWKYVNTQIWKYVNM